ncbi:hypothetical protein, partial [Caldibacillus thermoamylovorans]|uniref:hypothetical protein n=1 Tax=Caldibacillus thermoamylovorans TaxID=35841 RepID=UPI001D06F3FC
PAQNGDENESRRQKMGFPASKWRREKVSSPKNKVSPAKMPTRTGLVAKNQWKMGRVIDKNERL